MQRKPCHVISSAARHGRRQSHRPSGASARHALLRSSRHPAPCHRRRSMSSKPRARCWCGSSRLTGRRQASRPSRPPRRRLRLTEPLHRLPRHPRQPAHPTVRAVHQFHAGRRAAGDGACNIHQEDARGAALRVRQAAGKLRCHLGRASRRAAVSRHADNDKPAHSTR